ncbi:MAG: hypothetical protein QOG37_1008 [Mycobacterium sp.]|jgi:hypothetical protein|nr:hypothetical protein [Mycobacterium sp.]
MGPLQVTTPSPSVDDAWDDGCPGNIQSPGPWRRNGTPQKTSGVLFGGIQESRPTVAWTDDDDLFGQHRLIRLAGANIRPAVRVVVVPLLT